MDRKHFAGLDALRGVAALLVLALHIGQMLPSYRAVAHGYLGVDLFFGLSGFVLAAAYEPRLLDGTTRFMGYARQRLIRVYPMILVGLGLGVAVAATASYPPDHLVLRTTLQLASLPWLFGWGHTFVLNPTQWSLFFELGVNAVHAFFVRRLTMRVVATIVGISALCLTFGIVREGTANLGWDRHTWVWGFPRTSMSFFLGVLYCRLWRRGALPTFGRMAWLCVPALPALVIGVSFVGTGWADVFAVLVGLPAILLASISVTARGGVDRLCRWAGGVSYPLYATQGPLLEIAHRMIPPAYRASIVTWLGVVVVLIVIAHLLERHVDRPIRKQLGARRAAAATVP